MLFDYHYNIKDIYEKDFENTLKTNVLGSNPTFKDLPPALSLTSIFVLAIVKPIWQVRKTLQRRPSPGLEDRNYVQFYHTQ